MILAQVAEFHPVSFSISGFELVLLIAGATLTLALAGFFVVVLWRNRDSGSKSGGDNKHP
ncbi:MAG: hypothetical protein L0Y44_06355 [Phycisphaerales bacterium]|nr:hypothetical protein [Phycisphaerales bacterium]MCI0630261.1 hypothetical protein [Phycisphaerales bacterium]MCI0676696.1 hypothetical protein [Phycisphaerales bacterium]